MIATDTLPEVPLEERPTGRYVVELYNARTGKLEQREESDNYITPLWALHIAGTQYLGAWHAQQSAAGSVVYSPNAGNMLTGASGPFVANMVSPFATSPLPMDSLFCTDDATAEDTAEHWLRGNVIAWATRWKSTISAAGPRGQINESECAFSGAGLVHKTVWDFTTTQGNGTFQTVAIGSAAGYGNPTVQAYWTGIGPQAILLDGAVANIYTGNPNGIRSNLWIDSTGKAYYCSNATNSATSAIGIYSVPATIWSSSALQDGTIDARGVAKTTEVATISLNFTATTSATNPHNGSYLGLTRLGDSGDFVVAYCPYNNAQVYAKRITAAGAVVWTVAVGPLQGVNPTTLGVSTGIVYDGTYLYVACCGAAAGQVAGQNIYRLVAASGAASATIALPTNYTLAGNGMTMTGQNTGDLLVSTVGGLLRLSTAGAAVSPYNYGYPTGSVAPTETALAPWLTTANRYTPAGRDASAWTELHTRVASISAAFEAGDLVGPFGGGSTAPTSFLTKAGKLWAVCPTMGSKFGGTGGGVALGAVVGANMFSRTKLGAAVTKTSAQNMKISYELTFPNPYTSGRIHTHRSL